MYEIASALSTFCLIGLLPIIPSSLLLQIASYRDNLRPNLLALMSPFEQSARERFTSGGKNKHLSPFSIRFHVRECMSGG